MLTVVTKGLHKRVRRVGELLEYDMGIPSYGGRSNVLDTLIRTILSQNTNDVNRDRAYESMRQLFPTWNEVLAADPEELAESIRVGGLAPSKSGYILGVLKWVEESFGGFDIDFICDEDPAWVVETFTQRKGIGIKTISVVLAFACGKDFFPVDTHVNRVCRRLGFVPFNSPPEKTFERMRELIPSGKSYSIHMNMIGLGRSTCAARTPICEKCPLKNECVYYRDHVSLTRSARLPSGVGQGKPPSRKKQ